MDVTRRDWMVAGAMTLGTASLMLGMANIADAAEEDVVKEAVEILRAGILQADRSKLSRVCADQISYGHSDGRAETKEQFINGVLTRKQTVKSLAFPELKVSVVGDAAIARHIYLAESELDGKQTTTKIGALQV